MARSPETLDGKAIVSLWPTEGSRTTIVSHNWSDPTTWYTYSKQVTAETTTESVAGLEYDLANSPVVDTYHGKIWAEDNLTQYRVLVEVSTDGGTTWAEKTEADPHVTAVSGTNGDYVVNYDTGKITFHSSLPGGASVRASYYYVDLSDPNASHFVFAPISGKSLKIKQAEVQFTDDIVLNDTIVFETFGYVDVFAPNLLIANGGPLSPGTKVSIAKTTYKSMRDFYNEANGAMPTYPAMGGNEWRGLSAPVVVMQWDYAAVLPLSYTAGMETHIYLEHNEPLGGSYATASLYGLSEEE